MNPRPFSERLNAAINGIIYAIKTQRSVRLQFLIAFIVLLLSLFLPLSRIELLLIFFTVTLVIFAEIVNTAVELAVDIFSSSIHPLARAAKDVAAGGVLVACLGALVIAYFILLPSLNPLLRKGILIIKRSSEHLTLAALIGVILLGIALKVVLGRSSFHSKSMPSGYAALAFAICTALTFLTESPLVMLLSFGLAFLFSTSHLTQGTHARLEVILGALLGTLVTTLVFQVFG